MLRRLFARRRHAAAVDRLTVALEARDWAAAEELARGLVREAVSRSGKASPALVGAHYALASALLAQRRLDEAEASCRAAITIARRHPAASDPKLPQLLEQLAAILDGRGEHDALEKLFREMTLSYERMRAPDAAEQIAAEMRLALLLARSDRANEARSWFARAIAHHEAAFGSGDAGLAELLYNAASFEAEPSAAISLFERARSLSKDASLDARIAHNLGVALEEAKRTDEARAAYRAAAEAFAPSSRRPTLVRWARLEHAAGRFEEAAALYTRALEAAKAELSPTDPIVARIELWLGDARSEIFR